MNTVTNNNLTAEIAERAEVISTMTRPQKILLVFLAQPAYYLLFSALSASSAVNKKRSGKRINNYE